MVWFIYWLDIAMPCPPGFIHLLGIAMPYLLVIYIYIGALLCLGFIHLLGVEYLVHKGGKYTILHDMQIEHNPSMMLIYKEQHKGNHVSICIFIN